ncbi:alanine/glycine:cation symporter family protein [Agaribacterium haliotis]|uniref:alanine/glycine:cation symporter family protein n=1 Tax=Agaribacterium haliotis TaxID=2013869 RepID=UPI000BB57D03|nr:alanine/glycine:cation symporter family protein [Agaribacterium haliotis]
MQNLVDQLNAIIWSPALVYLCLASGLFFSIKTRFMQVRHIKQMLKLLKRDDKDKNSVSSFQALTISLSGRVGTGNIAGVATAIAFGGPGAIFWMWVVAFLGAATAFIESTLGQIYKEEINGQYRGGPAFYIEKCLNMPWAARVFAVTTIVAAGFLLPGVQSNSIANAIEFASPNALMPAADIKLLAAIVIAILLGLIIYGGTRRIARFTELVIPTIAAIYIGVTIVVIVSHIEQLPGIFALIFKDAFTPMAGFGAVVGWGVKRGIYSNEAGQGTGPHAAASARVDHPAQQGIVQAFSVYIDTLFICTATALLILITNSYNVHAADGQFFVQHLAADIQANGPQYTQVAIEKGIPGFGAALVALALSFFAFTTIVAYYYIAETNLTYLIRKTRWQTPLSSSILKFFYIFFCFLGCIKSSQMIWGLGDIGVGVMAWLNLAAIIAIFFVSKPAIKALEDYEKQLQLGQTQFSFSPSKLGVKNAFFWDKDQAEVTASDSSVEQATVEQNRAEQNSAEQGSAELRPVDNN